MGYSENIAEHSRRLEEFSHRDDRRAAGLVPARPKPRRGTAAYARRIANGAISLAVLVVATLVFGFVIAPIGVGGFLLVFGLALALLLLFALWPAQRPRKVAPFRDDMPNQAVVRRLDALLHNRRHSLPVQAALKAEAIERQLPLLESRLGELDALDPLAQDARRLMGRHLPELIERYERVPEQFRSERDGEGMTVDDRLVAGLDAANEAVSDLAARLSKGDVDAFQVQGRFLESRYRDTDGALKGE